MSKFGYGISAAAFAAALSLSPPAAAETPSVVVTLPPLHSITAKVMGDLGEPVLLLEGTSSPHGFALRPSHMKAIARADLVVLMDDHALETFMEPALEATDQEAAALVLGDKVAFEKLPIREGGVWDEHGHDHDEHGHDEHGHDEHAHDDHGHDDDKHAHEEHAHDDHAHEHDKHDHDEHAHDDHGHDHDKHAHEEHAHDDHGHDHDKHDHEEHAHDDHGHDDHGHDEHAHDDHHGHDHGGYDPHAWLDPLIAGDFAHAIAHELGEKDPANAATYEANADAFAAEIKELDAEISAQLAAVQGQPHIVFHDAYQYFQVHYGLNTVGSITVSPERKPGAKRLSELRHKIAELGAACLFSEPQFQPAVVRSIADDTGVATGELDPLGAALQPGPELYENLVRNLANSFTKCLSR